MVVDKHIQKWLSEGVISEPQAKRMIADLNLDTSQEKSNRLVAIMSIFGAILIFVGVAWMIARNWHQIPSVIKVLILIGSTLASFILGVQLRDNDRDKVGRSLLVLGSLLYTLSIFLISQIYHLATTVQHNMWILFLSWTVIVIIAYILDSPENLVVALAIFFPWVITQYWVIADDFDSPDVLGFGILLLCVGVILYALHSLHESFKPVFGRIYRFFTAAYFLSLFYTLSLQTVLEELIYNQGFFIKFNMFLLIFIAVATSLFAFAFVRVSSKASSSPSLRLESNILLGVIGLLLVMMIIAMSTSLWILWILFNFIFIGFIFLVVVFGQQYSSAHIVNLALFAFVLEIFTRYIGFWIDLDGYVAFGILAIIGGGLLIAGAMYLPKLRKFLLENRIGQSMG